MISKYIRFNDYVEVIKIEKDIFPRLQDHTLFVTCYFGKGYERIPKPFYAFFGLDTSIFTIYNSFSAKLFKGSEAILEYNDILKLVEDLKYSKCHNYWR